MAVCPNEIGKSRKAGSVEYYICGARDENTQNWLKGRIFVENEREKEQNGGNAVKKKYL